MAQKKINREEILKLAGQEVAGRLIEKQRHELERLREIERRVQASSTERLIHVLENNRNLWTNASSAALPRKRTHIDDPIHQHLLIEEKISPILYHPIVQRLSHIKQLSFSYLTFPTATHTRLSHSLGVCKNAELALGSILQKGIKYTAEGKREIELTVQQKSTLLLKAKVAALLHDLGHAPFGHGLDLYLSAETDAPSPDKFNAANYISQYLREVISGCGIDPEQILRILDPTKTKELDGYDSLVNNIIDSPLDVDRMDYLVRDAHMTGLSIGTVNIHALIERMLPFEGEFELEGVRKKQVLLVFEPSAIPYITHLLYARDSMYLNCYEHRTKVVAERMLMKAIDAFRRKHPPLLGDLNDLILLTDEQLLTLLLEYSDPEDVSYKYASALLKSVTFQLVFSIYPKKRERWEEKRKGNEAKEREEEEIPPKPAARIQHWEDDSLNFYKHRNLTVPNEWEEAIAKGAGLAKEDWWKVLVTVPSQGMFEPKFNEIKILLRKGNGRYSFRKLDEMTGFWEGVLKHLAVERYNISVFASPELSAAEITAVEKSAVECLTEPTS